MRSHIDAVGVGPQRECEQQSEVLIVEAIAARRRVPHLPRPLESAFEAHPPRQALRAISHALAAIHGSAV
jgi:hypothetical protein